MESGGPRERERMVRKERRKDRDSERERERMIKNEGGKTGEGTH